MTDAARQPEPAKRPDPPGSGADAEPAGALPAPIDTARDPEPPPAGAAAFAAQLLAGGPRRGLRGGPETLERARSVYLETEWSGPSDRRHRRGRITRTEI